MENFRLRVFRAVAHHLNFRQAAEELLLTQPAVTQQIKALEAELSAPLFDRSGGHISLTPAGEILLPFAEQLKRLSDEARSAVGAASGSTTGSLSIGASQTIGQYLLPRLIAGFVKEHPGVQASIVGGNTRAVLEELRARKIQLALIEGPALTKDVRVEPFMEDHMVCVVPAGHEWADQDVALEGLKEMTLLTREQGSGSRRIVEGAFRKAGLRIRDLKLGMTFDSTEGLLSAVEAGLGIAFVSRWAVRNQLALGTLKVVRIRGLSLGRTFSIAIPTGPDLSGLAAVFYRFVMQQAAAWASPSTAGTLRKKRIS